MIHISFNEQPLVDFAKSAGEVTLAAHQYVKNNAAKVAYYSSFAANAYTIGTGGYFNLINFALTAVTYGCLKYVHSENEGLSRREWDQNDVNFAQGAKINFLTNLVFGTTGFSTLNTIVTLGHALSSNIAVENKK